MLERVKRLRLDAGLKRMVFIFAGIVLLLAVMKPDQFFRFSIFQSMMSQFPEFSLLALGVMLALMCGGTDLSTVGIANLTSILCAKFLQAAFPPESAGASSPMVAVYTLGLGLLIGAACGAVNAVIIYKINIPPIVATIGTLKLFLGLGIGLTGGQAVSGMPAALTGFIQSNLFGILPVPTLIFIICVPLLAFLLEKTSFGVNLRLQGSNARAAQYAGIRKSAVYLQLYITSGCLSALAGIIMTGRMNSAKADYGISYTLLSILICVLGGVSPKGGKGRIGGVVLAAVTLQFVTTGMSLFEFLNPFYNQLLFGVLLIVALLLNYYADRIGLRNHFKRKPKKAKG